MSNYPRVEIPNIDNLAISFKKGAARISFEVSAPGIELLKLIHLQLTAQPMRAIIESPQSEMDLKITSVNLKTGEATS